MRIQRNPASQSIRIDSPAKLNLFLEVMSRRADGYHNISSVMCPIDLWDTLEIRLIEQPKIDFALHIPTIVNPGDDAWSIPSNANNLVVRAAELVQKSLSCSFGCEMKLNKRIPAAAGLGGGSGNAAAVVVGLLSLLGCWDRTLAEDLCKQLGSDLNFFLGSSDGFGLCLAEGRGETTHLIPHSPSLSFWLTHPSVGCSTAAVYSNVKIRRNRKKISEFIAACETGQESKIGASLFNALQLPASELNPWIDIQLQLLKDCGCRYRQMTGSGSCCYGLLPEVGLFEVLEYQAARRGIPRVYRSDTWFGPSIEHQIAKNYE